MPKRAAKSTARLSKGGFAHPLHFREADAWRSAGGLITRVFMKSKAKAKRLKVDEEWRRARGAIIGDMLTRYQPYPDPKRSLSS